MSERKTAEPPPTAGWFRRGEGSLGLIAPAIDEFEAPEMDLEQNVDCACERFVRNRGVYEGTSLTA